MKAPFMKTENNSSKYYLLYIIALIPIILEGILTNNLKSFLLIILAIAIATLVAVGCQLIKKESIKAIIVEENILYALLITLLLPLNINIAIYSLILIIILSLVRIFSKAKAPIVPIAILLILIVSYLTGNSLSINDNHLLTFTNYFIGYTHSNLYINSILLIIIGYLILCANSIYKKDIFLYTSGIYIILIFILSLIKNDLSLYFYTNNLNLVLFSYAFIAPLSKYSSYTIKGKIVYSLLISMITFILTILNINYGVIIAILIANILHEYIDKYLEKLAKLVKKC